MILSIDCCERDKISLSVRRGDLIIFKKNWSLAGHRKSELLLGKIEQFLRMHKIGLQEITEIRVSPDIKSFTSDRIAKCVAQMLMWAKGRAS